MLTQFSPSDVCKILQSVRHLQGCCDWNDRAFSIEKSALFSVVSRLAYCAIMGEERRNPHRAKFVPSSTFNRLVTQDGYSLDGAAAESETDLAVVRTRKFVATLIRSANQIFIGIRGTQFAHDVAIDIAFLPRFGANRWSMSPFRQPGFLHRGFYFEALALRELIVDRLDAWNASGRQVHLTGHSLGGAIAAIVSLLGLSRHPWEPDASAGCYVYGSPRIGSRSPTINARAYAVRRDFDPVPFTPPRIFFYVNHMTEFGCDGNLFVVEGSLVKRWADRVARVGMLDVIGHHFMEAYVRDIFAALPGGQDPIL